MFKDTGDIAAFFNLVSVYFYGDRFNPQAANQFMNLTSLGKAELDTKVRSRTSKLGVLMEGTVIPSVFNFYKDHPFCTPLDT